jgi:ketosteroid isomerase-like protein
MSTNQNAAVSADPGGVIAEFTECLNRGDLDGAMALYLPEAVFQAAPDEPAISGPERIRAALSEFLALNPTMQGELVKVHEAADTALVINRWQLSGADPAGQPLEMAGTSADVMRRRADGSWGILVDDPWGGGGPG